MQSVAFYRAAWYNAGMLPQDDAMLLSYINTKLRDEYSSLGELCASLDVDQIALENRLGAAGYVYDAKTNRFR